MPRLPQSNENGGGRWFSPPNCWKQISAAFLSKMRPFERESVENGGVSRFSPLNCGKRISVVFLAKRVRSSGNQWKTKGGGGSAPRTVGNGYRPRFIAKHGRLSCSRWAVVFRNRCGMRCYSGRVFVYVAWIRTLQPNVAREKVNTAFRARTRFVAPSHWAASEIP